MSNKIFAAMAAASMIAIAIAATPQDAVAAAGLTMTQFLVEPGCTPSRAGLLTGRYSPRDAKTDKGLTK